jgi:hypothetical protein
LLARRIEAELISFPRFRFFCGLFRHAFAAQCSV